MHARATIETNNDDDAIYEDEGPGEGRSDGRGWFSPASLGGASGLLIDVRVLD